MAAPLHWADIQQATFTRWVNDALSERGMHINDLKTDLCDGVNLINLLEIISEKSLGRYNRHPRIPMQKLANTSQAMAFLKQENVKLVNISNDDITEGRLRLIMGLIWTLILTYEIKGTSNDLLKWIQSKIPDYGIKGFTKDWNDGRAVCALTDALRPGTVPNHKQMNAGDALANATKGISLADRFLGIDQLVLPNEMINPKVDSKAMMTYLAQFRNIPDDFKGSDADRCAAYGPGLVEGVVGRAAPFNVEVPDGCRGNVVVKVIGPNDEAKVSVTKTNNELYDVVYNPTTPGEYQVHVMLGNEHIPGSIFHVWVAEAISVGGEGKILVFFSTTSSQEKTRRDNHKLKKLLEAKKVHLREDFEPWVPMDVVTKNDRDDIFEKAGTRNLPMIFIDDNYIGDYDALARMNDSGELDNVLNMAHQNLLSEDEHWARMGGKGDFGLQQVRKQSKRRTWLSRK